MEYPVKQGHRYRAWIEVSWPLSMAIDQHDIATRLINAGFSQVDVKKISGGSYVAEGVWLQPDSTGGDDHITHVQDLGPA